MPNSRIAALISEKLRTGIDHPGDVTSDQAAMPIILPAFRAAGMPPEMAELVNRTADLLGEAIVHTIETEGKTRLVPVDEQGQMKAAEMSPAQLPPVNRIIGVYCRCDRSRSNPLLMLTITEDNHVIIDGKQLLNGLAQRSAECPHGVGL